MQQLRQRITQIATTDETVLICGAETYYPRSADAVRGEQALIQGIPADYADDDRRDQHRYQEHSSKDRAPAQRAVEQRG